MTNVGDKRTEGKRLTKAELQGLRDIETLGRKAMRSRSALRVISSLMDKGMIEYDITEGTTYTPAGRAALGAEK